MGWDLFCRQGLPESETQGQFGDVAVVVLSGGDFLITGHEKIRMYAVSAFRYG